MDTLLVTILSGISYGVVLFLVAAGLSFVLGLMGIVNIAHGALVMTGAYVGLEVGEATRNLALGGIVGALLSGIVGLLIERVFLRKLYKFQLDQILVTFGFVYIITNIHLWIYGAWPKWINYYWTTIIFDISNFHYYDWYNIMSNTLVVPGSYQNRRYHSSRNG